MSSSSSLISSTSSAPHASQSNQGTNFSSSGATIYYGAVAFAILALVGLSLGSRIVYLKRARRQRDIDRVELARRGEEGGLPTYRETTSPHTLAYVSSPLGLLHPLRGIPISTPVPPEHPLYAPPAPIARVPGSSADGSEVHRAETARNGPQPPEYVDGPPKYA